MATQGRGFRHPPVRRLDPYAGAVLLLARQRLQDEGLAAAAAAPQARGKALINLLPLEQGERITTIMPLPEDEESWDTLDVMFATTSAAPCAATSSATSSRSTAPARSP